MASAISNLHCEVGNVRIGEVEDETLGNHSHLMGFTSSSKTDPVIRYINYKEDGKTSSERLLLSYDSANEDLLIKGNANDKYTEFKLSNYAKAIDFNNYGYKNNYAVVGNTTNWNTLVSPGSYKVQMSAWGNADTNNSPNSIESSLYSYGELLIIGNSVSDTEKRVLQIYMPHKPLTDSGWYARWHNGSSLDTGWGTWKVMKFTDTTVEPITSITSTSSNTDVPSAKAVYDLFTSIRDGNTMEF